MDGDGKTREQHRASRLGLAARRKRPPRGREQRLTLRDLSRRLRGAARDRLRLHVHGASMTARWRWALAVLLAGCSDPDGGAPGERCPPPAGAVDRVENALEIGFWGEDDF